MQAFRSIIRLLAFHSHQASQGRPLVYLANSRPSLLLDQDQAMSKGTSIKSALAKWESEHPGITAAEAERVELLGQVPSIEKMDGSLAALKSCRHLSLSSNNIEKISNLSGLNNLRVLSLGRNVIKKLEQLEPVSGTLEGLWISYNQLEKLTGLERLAKLKVLYASNNKLREWSEIDRLRALPALEELLLAGNPLHTEHKDKGTLSEYRLEVIKRLPELKVLDGMAVEVEERTNAALDDAVAAPPI